MIIGELQTEYDKPIITKVLVMKEFRSNQSQYLNYYYSDPQKPFCENIVRPTLQVLLDRFGRIVDRKRLF